jgi:hypothetical protein
MAASIITALVSTALGYVAGKLLEQKNKDPLTDEKPTTLSSKGSFVPQLVGAGKVAPVVGWAANRTVMVPGNGNGGKGSAPDNNDTVYREYGWHFLGIGPCQRILQITKNGNPIPLPLSGDLLPGIGPTDSPNGQIIDLGEHGSLRFYWGTQDQEPNAVIGAATGAAIAGLGVLSSWPFMIQALWSPARLGGFPTWQSLEYELEIWPLRENMLTDTGNTAAALDPIGSLTGGYPARLVDSVPMYRGDTIGAGRTTLSVRNATPSILGGNPATIKVAGDHAAEFDPATSPGTVDLEGQFFGSANRRYVATAASYSAPESYIQGTFYTTISNFVVMPWDFQSSTWVKYDTTVNPEAGIPAPTGIAANTSNPYRLIKNLPGTIDPADPSQHSRVALRPTASHVHWHDEAGNALWGRQFTTYVHDPWDGRGTGKTEARVDLYFYTDSAADHYETTFTFPSNDQATITNKNGTIGVATQKGNGWWKLQIFMHVYDGFPQSLPSTQWTIGLRFGEPHPDSSLDAFLVVMTPARSEFASDSTASTINPGSVQSNVTTITLGEDVTDMFGHRGTAAGSTVGTGPWGFNAAHILYQLMFETVPHGAGRDVSRYDIPSLEAVGVKIGADGERLLSHALAVGGESYDKTIASIMLDLGILIPWDVTKGKYVFTLVREEDPSLVPAIPDDWVLPNLPEIDTHHRPNSPDRLQFGYSKRPKYRDEPISIDDDGKALLGIASSNVQTLPIYTATDPVTAAKIADRRAGEVLTLGSKYKVSLQKGARELKAGDLRTFGAATGIEETLRILTAKPSAGSSKVVIEATTDTYALSAEVPVIVPDPPGAAAIVASAEWGVLEVPAVISEGRVAVWAPLDYLSSSTTGGQLWLSQDDSEYVLSTARVTPAISGSFNDTLLAADAQSPAMFISRGTEVAALGDDAWRAGRLTLAIISPAGVEYCFFKQLDLDPDLPWLFRASSLIRGRLGTTPLDHPGDAIVWIFNYRNINLIADPLLRVDEVLYSKMAFRSLAGTVGIAGTEAKTLTPTGAAVWPGSPTGFAPQGRVLEWRLGAGVTFEWGAKHEAGWRKRTGAGYQTPGTLVTPLPGPEVQIRFLTIGLTQKRVITVSGDYDYHYSSGLIDADFGAGIPFIAEIKGTHPQSAPAVQIRLNYRA